MRLMNSPRDSTRQHILDTAKPIIIQGKAFAAVGINEVLTAAAVPKARLPLLQIQGVVRVKHCSAIILMVIWHRRGSCCQAASKPPRGVCWRIGKAGDSFDLANMHAICLVVKLTGRISRFIGSDAAGFARWHPSHYCAAGGLHRGRAARWFITAALEPQSCAESLYQMWLGASLLLRPER